MLDNPFLLYYYVYEIKLGIFNTTRIINNEVRLNTLKWGNEIHILFIVT